MYLPVKVGKSSALTFIEIDISLRAVYSQFTAGSIPVICFMCSDQENHKQRSSKSAVGPRGTSGVARGADAVGPARRGPVRAAMASGDVKTKSTKEEETYRVRDSYVPCGLNGSFYFY